MYGGYIISGVLSIIPCAINEHVRESSAVVTVTKTTPISSLKIRSDDVNKYSGAKRRPPPPAVMTAFFHYAFIRGKHACTHVRGRAQNYRIIMPHLVSEENGRTQMNIEFNCTEIQNFLASKTGVYKYETRSTPTTICIFLFLALFFQLFGVGHLGPQPPLHRPHQFTYTHPQSSCHVRSRLN